MEFCFAVVLAEKGGSIGNFSAPVCYDSLAEWSKVLASGASPKGRGFEPHSCHFIFIQVAADGHECAGGKGTTARGFEPLRAEPNGFRAHHLDHSVTLSMSFLLLGMSTSTILDAFEKCGK